jgi:hypothetical protein
VCTVVPVHYEQTVRETSGQVREEDAASVYRCTGTLRANSEVLARTRPCYSARGADGAGLVGPAGHRPPRYPTRFEPSFIELSRIL